MVERVWVKYLSSLAECAATRHPQPRGVVGTTDHHNFVAGQFQTLSVKFIWVCTSAWSSCLAYIYARGVGFFFRSTIYSRSILTQH